MSTELVDIAKLQDEQKQAKSTIIRGFLLVILVPIVVAFGVLFSSMSDSFGPLLIASLYTVIGGAVGVASLVAGALRSRLASKQLLEIEEARIPKARLLT